MSKHEAARPSDMIINPITEWRYRLEAWVHRLRGHQQRRNEYGIGCSCRVLWIWADPK